MTRSEKATAVEVLKGKFEEASFFYLADASTLTVEQINKFRGLCYEKDIEMKVVKNTLAKKALESFPEERNYIGLYESLKGPTAILFTTAANVPAKVIKEFRKTSERPILKAAYIDTDIYVGDEQLDALATLKSKEDLIGDIITLLQSPIKNVLGSLQSGGNTLSGLLKTLEERGE
jgi:large subunit ribosomal protein L10